MKFLLIALALLGASVGHACDVCGCSLAGGGFGLLSGTTRHFVGISYSSLYYRNASAPVRDRFQRTSLVGQLQFGNRWRLAAEIPLVHNVRRDGRAEGDLSVSGLGDPGLQVSYALADRTLERGGRLLVQLGGGVSLPLGQFDGSIVELNVPEDFNPGRGAATFLAEARAQMSWGNWAGLASVRTERSAYNTANYRFGSRCRVLAKAFYRVSTPRFGLVPNAGLDYQRVAPSTRRNSSVALHGSGGNVLTGRLGAQLERNDWVFGLESSVPVYQAFGEDLVTASPSAEATLILKF